LKTTISSSQHRSVESLFSGRRDRERWQRLSGGVVATTTAAQHENGSEEEQSLASDAWMVFRSRVVASVPEGDQYPIMACLMVLAVMIKTFNLVADILYGYLDPRVRFD
jgi:hypothetical protein